MVLDPSQADMVNKLGAAEQQARDAIHTGASVKPGTEVRGYWPSGGTVVRVLLVVIGVLIVASWALTALNH
jgi:hypothetical protein